MPHTQVVAKDVGSAANLRRRSKIFLELALAVCFMCGFVTAPLLCRGPWSPVLVSALAPVDLGSAQSFRGALSLRLTSYGTQI